MYDQFSSITLKRTSDQHLYASQIGCEGVAEASGLRAVQTSRVPDEVNLVSNLQRAASSEAVVIVRDVTASNDELIFWARFRIPHPMFKVWQPWTST